MCNDTKRLDMLIVLDHISLFLMAYGSGDMCLGDSDTFVLYNQSSETYKFEWILILISLFFSRTLEVNWTYLISSPISFLVSLVENPLPGVNLEDFWKFYIFLGDQVVSARALRQGV